MDTRYKINPEIEAYLPPGTEDENRLLEAEIVADGFIRDPIIVWKETDTIIDGHRRYRIAQKHGLTDCMKVQKKSFEHIDQVFRWMDEHQMGRRNLPDEARRYRLGKLVEQIKAKAEEKGNGSAPKINVVETVARQTGVSKSTVKRAAKFKEHVDQLSTEERDAILAGKAKKKPKAPKAGGAKFQQEKYDKSYKNLVRIVDETARNHGDVTRFGNVRESQELLGLHRLLKQFHTDFKAFLRMLQTRETKAQGST